MFGLFKKKKTLLSKEEVELPKIHDTYQYKSTNRIYKVDRITSRGHKDCIELTHMGYVAKSGFMVNEMNYNIHSITVCLNDLQNNYIPVTIKMENREVEVDQVKYICIFKDKRKRKLVLNDRPYFSEQRNEIKMLYCIEKKAYYPVDIHEIDYIAVKSTKIKETRTVSVVFKDLRKVTD